MVGGDARPLTPEILPISEGEFRVAFRGSAMKRAKLVGRKRNADAVNRNAEQ